MGQTTATRITSLVLWITLIECFIGHLDCALAQAPPVYTYTAIGSIIGAAGQAISPLAATGPVQPIAGSSAGLAQATGLSPGPSAPPLDSPPPAGPLPSGVGNLSLGPWLLYPSLGLSTLYDHNIYYSPTLPLSGPAFNIAPALRADYNTGIFDTQWYANIGSTIYPTLNPLNNTFNWQAGFSERYSPLRDLVFSITGNYAHSTLAYVTTSSLPTPIVSPITPTLPGVLVLATPQIAVNPNDTATATANVYKEFNRAFINFGGTIAETQYESASLTSPNYNMKSYYGTGGVWVTPLFYAFGDGIDAFTTAVGTEVSSFRARGGIGSASIGLFRGSIYYGWQGSEVPGSGTASGPIYGGTISYAPTAVWTFDLSIDELVNISNITSLPAQGGALGGLPGIGAAVGINESAQITSATLRSNYAWSPQTSIFAALSPSRIAFIGSSRVDSAWLATVGVTHTVTSNLTLNGTFQYNTYISPVPAIGFTNYVLTIGAVYTF